MSEERQRIDVWLFRARLVKTRAAAARLVGEGGVRLTRDGASRQLDRASVEVAPGDAVTLPRPAKLRTIRVLRLGLRRGPAPEARALYEDVSDAE